MCVGNLNVIPSRMITEYIFQPICDFMKSWVSSRTESGGFAHSMILGRQVGTISRGQYNGADLLVVYLVPRVEAYVIQVGS
jgi:hypothetical protein